MRASWSVSELLQLEALLASEYLRGWPTLPPTAPLLFRNWLEKRLSLLLDFCAFCELAEFTFIEFTFSLSNVILRKFLAFSLLREMLVPGTARLPPVGLVLPEACLEEEREEEDVVLPPTPPPLRLGPSVVLCLSWLSVTTPLA